MTKRRIMFNEDNTHQFYEYWVAKLDRLTPEIAEEYISQYVGSQITDYLINVNSLNSSFPSKVLTSYADKYLQKKENGLDVDYTDTHARYYYQAWVEDGYDMYAHWIQLLKKLHIRPWLSFRMNDCHENFQQAGMMLSDFYHERKDLRRTAHHGPVGYYDNCFDYGKKEVRDRMLAYIDEAIGRYDGIDGIELDFIREPFCFSIGGEYEGQAIMTQFMRDVNAIVDKYARARRHKIIVSARVPRSPEDCKYMGFDVLTWAKENLVKVIVASPRWSPTDNDIPVEFWKQILAPYKVEFAAAVELILKSCPTSYCPTLNTHETAIASCYHNMCAGADFAYLFNYMHSNVTDYNDPTNEVMYSDLYKWDNYQQLIRHAGEKETCLQCVRRHIPSMQDCMPDWKLGEQSHMPANCFNPHDYKTIRARTGVVPKTDKVLLILGAEGKDDKKMLFDGGDFEIFINSKPVSKYVGTEHIHPAWTENTGYIFEVDPSILTQVNEIEVSKSKDGKPFIVDFCEIRCIPQKTE